MSENGGVVQVVMGPGMFDNFKYILKASNLAAVPLPQEVVGAEDLPTYVVWPIEQAKAAGFPV